jgi:hypothetical protein
MECKAKAMDERRCGHLTVYLCEDMPRWLYSPNQPGRDCHDVAVEVIKDAVQQRDELAAALRRVQQWFKYPKMDDRPTEVIKAALERVEEGL